MKWLDVCVCVCVCVGVCVGGCVWVGVCARVCLCVCNIHTYVHIGIIDWRLNGFNLKNTENLVALMKMWSHCEIELNVRHVGPTQ